MPPPKPQRQKAGRENWAFRSPKSKYLRATARKIKSFAPKLSMTCLTCLSVCAGECVWGAGECVRAGRRVQDECGGRGVCVHSSSVLMLSYCWDGQGHPTFRYVTVLLMSSPTFQPRTTSVAKSKLEPQGSAVAAEAAPFHFPGFLPL